ncbi:MAG TPA: SCO family protein [Terriglobia bacterium]|nr:SCO family protein [Terriglobia bacterium]
MANESGVKARRSGVPSGAGLPLRGYPGAKFLMVLWLLCGVPLSRAQTSSGRPQLLRDVGIDQKLNEEVPLDLTFVDETGQSVALRQFFNGKPVVLALVYYECPMLCTQVLNGLVRSLKEIKLDAGHDFNVVAVSINPRESWELAAVKKRVYVGIYERKDGDQGWHFLTGPEASSKALAASVGFRYAYDPVTGQYAHASGIMVLTPEGRVSRYFYGIEFPSRDLRLGLVEASANKIGSPVDQLLLFCYHYDPMTGKYGLVIRNVIRAAGIVTVLAIAGFMLVMFRRERETNIQV